VNLNRANLSNAKLTAINLSRANLNGVILTDTSFQGANLSEADLSNVDFTETKLTFPEMYKTPIQLAKYPILYFLDQAIFKIGVFILMPSRKLWKGGEETSWQRCKTGPACPWDLTREKISPDFQKASPDKAVNSGKETFA